MNVETDKRIIEIANDVHNIRSAISTELDGIYTGMDEMDENERWQLAGLVAAIVGISALATALS